MLIKRVYMIEEVNKMTTTTLLAYVAVAAGVAAIIKIVTSSKGRVSIPGVNISWGS